MPNEIKLPRLKENVESYEVTEVLVTAGQAVAKDQPLLVVNADKSNLEVYAPMPGKLVKLNVKVGDEIKIGSVYCVIEGGNGAAPQPARSAEKPATAAAPKSNQGTQQRKDDHIEEPSPKDVKTIKASVGAAAPRRAAIDGALGAVIPASPATRWLARKLDVDLKAITGTGPGGRITEDDVRTAYGGASAGAPAAAPAKPLPNFEQFGPVQREPLTKTRRLTAQQMHLAWSTIPHVTQHDAADVTDLEAFRKSREGKGVKLTVTAFALKAVAIALRQFPTFNSSLDLAGGQLILKKYVHVGVAVDTKGGLLVPVIRDVDKKGVEELAAELTDTAERRGPARRT